MPVYGREDLADKLPRVEIDNVETALYDERRRGHLHREEHGVPLPGRELRAAVAR
jgi:hypothetical protein